MAEPHDSLLAFLADLGDQAEAFGRTNEHPLVREVLDDLRVRLIAEGVVVTADATRRSDGHVDRS